MIFYHYTTKKFAKTITREQISGAPTDPWNCLMNQPQKWSWYTDQHPAGFYLTTYAPNKFEEKKDKLGTSKLDDPYVLIFAFDWVGWSDIKKVGNKVSSGNVKITKVGEPEKYCTNRVGENTSNAEDVPFQLAHCVWCGPIADVPKKYLKTADFI